MADDEITVREAADMLGLDESAIRRAIQRGHMEARRIGKRVWFVKRADVLAYPLRRAGGEKRGRKRQPAEEQP